MSTKVATKDSKNEVGFSLDLTKMTSIVENTDGGDDAFAPFVSLNGADGTWREESFNPDDEYLINPMSFKKGKAAWSKKLGNAPAEKVWRYLIDNPQPIEGDELPPIPKNHTWQDYIEFTIKHLDTGKEFVFSCGNTSSVNSAKSLIKEIFSPSHGHDLNKELPIVTFKVKEFTVASVGKTAYKPVFTVTDWVSTEDVKFDTPIGESNI